MRVRTNFLFPAPSPRDVATGWNAAALCGPWPLRSCYFTCLSREIVAYLIFISFQRPYFLFDRWLWGIEMLNDFRFIFPTASTRIKTHVACRDGSSILPYRVSIIRDRGGPVDELKRGSHLFGWPTQLFLLLPEGPLVFDFLGRCAFHVGCLVYLHDKEGDIPS